MKIRPVHFLLVLLLVVLVAPLSFNLPQTEIPLTAQTLVLFAAAILLKPFEAVLLAMVYLFLGAIGLPVFAGYSSGFEKLMGSSAGFLWAFVPVMWFLSSRLNQKKVAFFNALLLFFLAHIFVLLAGGIWMLGHSDFSSVLNLIVIKLLPVALLKSVLLSVVYLLISFLKKG